MGRHHHHHRIWVLTAILIPAWLSLAIAQPIVLPGEVDPPATYAVHAAVNENHNSNPMQGAFPMPDFCALASLASSLPSSSSSSTNSRDPSSTLKDVTDMLSRHETQSIIQNSIIQPLNQPTQQLTGDVGDASSNSSISSIGANSPSFNAQQFGSLVPFGIQIPLSATALSPNDFSSSPFGAPVPPSSPGPTSGPPPPSGSPPPSSSSDPSSSSESLEVREGDLTPLGPEPSVCGSKDFECQMLKACYGCYKDISLSHCTSCLLLKHCDKPDLPCQMQKSCRVCQAIRGKQQFYQPKLCRILHC